MSFESKPGRRPPLLHLGLLALILFCALAGAEVRAAGVRVCLTEEVKDATVTLLKDGKPLTSVKVTQEPDDKKCYSKTGLTLGSNTAYGLLIQAPGYKDKTESLNTSALDAKGFAAPQSSVTLEKEATGGGGGGGGGDTPKGVHVCIKDKGSAAITNANVAVVSTDERHPLSQDEKARQCYGDPNLSLDSAKKYTVEVTAEGYKPNSLPLDLATVKRGDTVEATLEKEQVPNLWRTVAAIAAIVVPFLAVLAALLFWWKRRPREEARIVNLSPRPETAQTDATPEEVTPGPVAPEPLEGIRSQLETISQHLGKIVGLLEALGQEAREEERQRAAEAATNRDRRPPPAFVKPEPSAAVTQQDGAKLARTCYANFLRGDSVMPEPIFLSAEGGSSMMDMFGSKPAVLELNPQGALVLFRTGDDGDSGWVYPNTQLHYREEALRKVFPGFKEEQFKLLKESKSIDSSGVEPVRVKKLDMSRWQVSS